MKQKYLLVLLAIVVAACFIINTNLVQQHLDAYASSSAQERFGNQRVSLEHENKIRAIAAEMAITQPFEIRKMNQTALAVWGYWNAVTYFPQLLNVIPISNKPFLFMSESFFDELSPSEYRYLIGHELIHIKEHHVQFLPFIVWTAVILLSIVCYMFYLRFIKNKVGLTQRARYARYGLLYLLVVLSIAGPDLIGFAYRRYIEAEADQQSLTALHSYDGALKMFKRWVRDYKMPQINNFYGIFASHPGCDQRELMCVQLQQNHMKG